MPARPKPEPKPAPAPAPPKDEAPATQAAVDAAVAVAIREEIKRNAAAGESAHFAAAEAEKAAEAPSTKRSPKDAAADLQKFLSRTGRFGTLKDRPEEVKAAQRDLGVKDDGIVGPKTREAARQAGVVLPPLNPRAKKK